MPAAVTRLSQPLIHDFSSARPIRTGSLIVSIFGDSVVPRGGVVWLGSLIRALEPLGISHRLVRTAAYRLVQAGILTSEQEGRRSYYALTSDGRRQFEEASERIYAPQQSEWDGRWCLLFTNLLSSEQKADAKASLRWLGFGQFGSDVVAHPSPDRIQLARHLDRLGLRPESLVFDAEIPSDQSHLSISKLVSRAWDLTDLEQAYANYIAKFHPILNALDRTKTLDLADAFYVRTFMVHGYRKVLLRDPGLPRELLPSTWKGHSAYQLSRDLYHRVRDASEGFVSAQFSNQIGTLPQPSSSFYRRFGGS